MNEDDAITESIDCDIDSKGRFNSFLVSVPSKWSWFSWSVDESGLSGRTKKGVPSVQNRAKRGGVSVYDRDRFGLFVRGRIRGAGVDKKIDLSSRTSSCFGPA